MISVFKIFWIIFDSFLHRCLVRWAKGEKLYRRLWNEVEINRINTRMDCFNDTKPKELHRKIRDLSCISHWKGTEFRTFLLYFGIVLLKGTIPMEEYECFLYLFCAVTICSTDKYRPTLAVARAIFVDFIEMYTSIYGACKISSNVHNLCHVVDDVERFGSLPTISTYTFENQLHLIKLNIKQCNKPLQQVARRLIERSNNQVPLANLSKVDFKPILNKQFLLAGDVVPKYKEILMESYILSSVGNKNRYFLSSTKEIVEFDYAFWHNGDHYVYGAPFLSKCDFFSAPISSSRLNIFQTNYVKGASKMYKVSSIEAKLFCLRIDSGFVFVPLVHTLK